MHIFGMGGGHLPEWVDRIARQHDAQLVNHVDPECHCGYGCRPYSCKRSRRHWFTTRNLGNPYDQRTARVVLNAVHDALEKHEEQYHGDL